MAWTNAVITNKGLEMLRQSIDGGELTIVSASSSDEIYPAASLMVQNTPANEKQTFNITEIKNMDNGIRVRVTITNEGLTTRYVMKQLCVWARLSENEEPQILAFLQDEVGTSIPAEGEIASYLMQFYVLLKVDTATNMKITISDAVFTTLNDFNSHTNDAVKHITADEREKWNDKLETDGEGKDVTVTFTEAATRTNISTSEKLSVIFGKIKKWFTDLGSAAFKNVPSTGNAAANEVVLGNDTRMTDSRTPKAHKSSHSVGGTDEITPGDIGAPTKDEAQDYASTAQTNARKYTDSLAKDYDKAGAASAVKKIFDNHIIDAVKHITSKERAAWNNKAEKNHSHSFGDITEKPTSYPPSPHTHPYIPTSQKGTPGGVAGLNENKEVEKAKNADTVDGYHLNQDVRSTASPTFANVNTPSFENFKINGSLINKVIAPDCKQIAQSPIAGFLWHDVFAFCKIGIPTFETSSDGNTWVSATLNKGLFAHKEDQAITCLEASNTKAVRWIWNTSDMGWNAAEWLVLGFTYVENAPNITVIIQTGSDGKNWAERHRSTGNYSSNPYWFYLAGHGGDYYMRITIIHNSGGDVKLLSMRLLTARWGDQGKGSELKYPYTWDANQFMFVNSPPKDSNSNLIATTAFVNDKLRPKTQRFVIGTSTAGWTKYDCDYLCDGKDDQVEINNALNALPNRGGEIVILDGVYYISNKITVFSKNNISIKGNGFNTILKRLFNSSYESGFFNLSDTDNLKIESLKIDGNKENYNSSDNDGIKIWDKSNALISNCLIVNNAGNGISLWSTSNVLINCNILLNNINGVHLTGSIDNIVCNNICKDNICGVLLDGSIGSVNNSLILGNICTRGGGKSSDYSSTQYSIKIDRSNNTLVSSNLCMGKAVVVEGGSSNTSVNNKYN